MKEFEGYLVFRVEMYSLFCKRCDKVVTILTEPDLAAGVEDHERRSHSGQGNK